MGVPGLRVDSSIRFPHVGSITVLPRIGRSTFTLEHNLGFEWASSMMKWVEHPSMHVLSGTLVGAQHKETSQSERWQLWGDLHVLSLGLQYPVLRCSMLALSLYFCAKSSDP